MVLAGVLLNSCTSVLEGGVQSAFVSICYTADEEVINKSDLHYSEMETDMELSIRCTGENFPDYDEYLFNVGEISHNPFELLGICPLFTAILFILRQSRNWNGYLQGNISLSDRRAWRHGRGSMKMTGGSVRVAYFKDDAYSEYPYVWSGSSPPNFDCSGFVSRVVDQSGVGNVGRQTAQGLYNLCTPIPKESLRPGDLVFFTGTYSSANPVTYVGIYVGGGRLP